LAVIPNLLAVIPNLLAVIPNLLAVIPNLLAVIPDLIRDPRTSIKQHSQQIDSRCERIKLR
ncbi:MAG: hypothetical protein SH820_09325, partial [Xanthomonadales bacterium]|nr:hypothetical protein [Xanthomonadales bacterium]